MTMSTPPPTDEPVVLGPPSLEYKQRFEEERLRVAIGLRALPRAIEHIGSTAIAGIRCKPIVDTLIGLRALPLSAAIEPLEALGYTHRKEAGNEGRLVFKLREGERAPSLGDAERLSPCTFHAHVVLFDGDEWRRHVVFRDWMNLHPEKAKEYEALKVELAARFERDRAAYTEGKTAFVERMLDEAARFPALRLLRT